MGKYLDTLTADMKAAMKAKEKDRLQVLRLAIHAIKQKLQEGTAESLSDADELVVLQKAVKSRRDSIQQAEELNRPDIAEAEKAELVILQAYLPELLTGAELATKVKEVAAEVGYSGPSDTGKFMGAWMKQYKGKADGREVQQALKELN